MGRFLSVSGSHADIGHSIGAQCRNEIQASLAMVSDEICKFASLDEAREKAEKYLPYIENVAGHLIEELQGLADGAEISMADALLLQLRFEVVGFDGRGGEGCSSFAIKKNGHRVTGQNVDAPSLHKQLGMVLKITPNDGRPAMLMYNYYAGMIGYVGINSLGLSVFGNAVLAPGWRVGFPRYLLVRLALEQSTVDEVEKLVRAIYRASTINLMLSDSSGTMRNIELAIDDMDVLHPEKDSLFHTNHYVCESLLEQERLLPILPDSSARYARGRKLISNMQPVVKDGSFLDEVKCMLSDHSNFPSSICRHKAEPSEHTSDQWESVASIIAQPDEGRMQVCFGNPCEEEYESYSLN